MNQRNLSRWQTCTAAVCIFATLAALGSCGVTLLSRSTRNELTFARSQDAPSSGEPLEEVDIDGEYHDPLRVAADFAGVADPQFTDASSTVLHGSDEIIGITVNDRAYAFSRRAMHAPIRHIIHLQVDDVPICVTYCDMVDQARVLTRPHGTDPIGLRVGGQDIHNQLVFLLDGTRYGQSSPDLPLDDFPFERTTLAQWIAKYPDTMIYEG